MEPFRLPLIVLGGFSAQLLLLPWIPFGEILLEPLFLIFVYLAFKAPSTRFLWLYGLCLGFLKDCATGGLFGTYSVSFALAGALFGMSRYALEREDRLIRGFVTGVLVGILAFFSGIFSTWADPAVGWNRWWWLATPLGMAANGWIATAAFPKLDKFL